MKDNGTVIKLHDDVGEKPPVIAEGGILHQLRVSIVATIVLALICCGVYPMIVWGLSQAIFHDKADGSLIRDGGGQVIGSKLIGQNFSDAKYFHPRPSAAGSGYDTTASGGSNLGPTSAKLINGTTKPSPPPAAAPEVTVPAILPTAATSPVVAATTAPATQPAVMVENDGIKLRVLHYCDDNGRMFEMARDGKAIVSAAFEKEFKNAARWDEVKLILAFNDAEHPLSIKALKPIPVDAVTASASGLDPHISLENAEIQVDRVAVARKISPDAVRKLILENTDGRDLGILGEPGVNVLALNMALDKTAPGSPGPATAPGTKQ